jgi:hypothetical protein
VIGPQSTSSPLPTSIDVAAILELRDSAVELSARYELRHYQYIGGTPPPARNNPAIHAQRVAPITWRQNRAHIDTQRKQKALWRFDKRAEPLSLAKQEGVFGLHVNDAPSRRQCEMDQMEAVMRSEADIGDEEFGRLAEQQRARRYEIKVGMDAGDVLNRPMQLRHTVDIKVDDDDVGPSAQDNMPGRRSVG